MPSRRLLLLPLLAGLTVFVAGALTLQTTGSSPVVAPPPTLPLRPEAAAAATLHRALAALEPNQQRWVQAHVWQQVHVPHLDFQADGSYESGPGHRLRLDLQIRTETSQGRVSVVSDGQTLWQERQVAGGAATVTRIELARVLRVLAEPAAGAAWDEFQASHLFGGPQPLLRRLRQQVTFTRQDRLRWRGHDVWLLTGARHDLPGTDCENYFPRQCRLYLDAATLWPCRLEWWGPAPKRPGDVLISEMELRNPVFDHPVAEGAFAYQPGKKAVTDETEQWLKTLALAQP